MIDRLVVINDLAEPKGGATALALEGAMACSDRGLSVTYICGDAGANPALHDRGIDLIALRGNRLHAAGTARAMTAGLYNAAARRLLTGWIKDHDTPGTVYHVHGWAQILSPAIFAALRPVMHRVVLHAHDFFLACPNGSFSYLKSGKVCAFKPLSPGCVAAQCDRRNYVHKLWRVARQHLLRRLYDLPNVPQVLMIHEAMRPFMMRAGIPDRSLITLPNPVRPFRAERIRAETNSDILFVGRLESTKGPDLAAAAARVARVPMRFIGDGEMRRDLERAYPEMSFVGRVPPDEIGLHARTARALVMPSRYPEPYGLAAAEALWSGLPVIAAETAFLASDIVQAGAGLGVDPRDTPRFASILRQIGSDNDAVAAMSEAAFERTRGIGLEPAAWVDRLIAQYEVAVARPTDTRA